MSIDSFLDEHFSSHSSINYKIICGMNKIHHEVSIKSLENYHQAHSDLDRIDFVYSENSQGNFNVSFVINFQPKDFKDTVIKSYLYGLKKKETEIDSLHTQILNFDSDTKYVSNITHIDWIPNSIQDSKLAETSNINAKSVKTESSTPATVDSKMFGALKKESKENIKNTFFKKQKTPPKTSPKKATPKKVEEEESPVKRVRKRAVLFDSSEDEADVTKSSKILVNDSIIDSSIKEEEEDAASEPKKKSRKSEVAEKKPAAKKKTAKKGAAMANFSDDEHFESAVRIEEEAGEEKPKITTSMLNAQNSGAKNKKKKLVDVTTRDEDGFLVTEKVWKTDSEDETEEAPTKKEEEVKAPAKGEPSKPVKKMVSKISDNVKSKPKQASLTNFFKKN